MENTLVTRLTDERTTIYNTLFDKHKESTLDIILSARAGLLLANKANGLLKRETLADIWELCDQSKTGVLTRASFIMAMYMIDHMTSHIVPVLPKTLPTKLRTVVDEFINLTENPIYTTTYTKDDIFTVTINLPCKIFQENSIN